MQSSVYNRVNDLHLAHRRRSQHVHLPNIMEQREQLNSRILQYRPLYHSGMLFRAHLSKNSNFASASPSPSSHVVLYSFATFLSQTPLHSSQPKCIGVMRSSVAVLGLDVVGKRLGLLVLGSVVVAVVVVLGADIVHLVDAAALGATLNGAFLGELLILSAFISILTKMTTPERVNNVHPAR